jgi:hypothetical protein
MILVYAHSHTYMAQVTAPELQYTGDAQAHANMFNNVDSAENRKQAYTCKKCIWLLYGHSSNRHISHGPGFTKPLRWLPRSRSLIHRRPRPPHRD